MGLQTLIPNLTKIFLLILARRGKGERFLTTQFCFHTNRVQVLNILRRQQEANRVQVLNILRRQQEGFSRLAQLVERGTVNPEAKSSILLPRAFCTI
jgi:hypothetical protein